MILLLGTAGYATRHYNFGRHVHFECSGIALSRTCRNFNSKPLGFQYQMLYTYNVDPVDSFCTVCLLSVSSTRAA